MTGSTPGAYNVGSAEGSGGTSAVPSVLPTVESQVDTSLHDELLSLVATGAVESKQDGKDDDLVFFLNCFRCVFRF